MTPRRWLAYCNPELSTLISQTLGSDEWIKHADKLQGLKKHADDKGFQAKWRAIKTDNKQRLADKIKVRPMQPVQRATNCPCPQESLR